jgi:DNA gyrase inhibitor GyrI
MAVTPTDLSTLHYPRYGYSVMGQGKAYFTTSIRNIIKGGDYVELTFYPGWGTVAEMNDLCNDLHTAGVKVGHYVVMNEIPYNDSAFSAHRTAALANGWYARRPAGSGGGQVAWSNAFGTYETNTFDITATDANGDRYPQWYAKNQVAQLAGVNIDMFRQDNVFCKPRTIYYNAGADNSNNFTLMGSVNAVSPTIDVNWFQDGVSRDNRDEAVAQKMRAANAAFVASLRAQLPNILVGGNHDSDASSFEYQNTYDSNLFEGLMGTAGGIYQFVGGRAAQQFVATAQRNVRDPSLTMNLGHGTGQTAMRHELGFTTVFSDAFWANTASQPHQTQLEETTWDLGVAIDAAIGAPNAAVTAGTSTCGLRRFQKGVVISNIGSASQTVTGLPNGLHKNSGLLDPTFNNGAGVVNNQIAVAANASVFLYY